METILVAAAVLVIVMTGMAFLAALFVGLRAAAGRIERRRVPAPEGIDAETLAVLAAAAREAIGTPVVLHRGHVHRAAGAESWSRAGRMDIMISHRMEPKR